MLKKSTTSINVSQKSSTAKGYSRELKKIIDSENLILGLVFFQSGQ